ncbi:C-8 sterol isomerase [Kalmusia sp. IMI 367209]|nr:C-8 sterol isomerase [Kalmusia sp. IMI 367209]
MRLLTSIGVVVAALSSLMYMLDSHLPKFYIFDPAELHTLSQSAIAAHGNDTRAVVDHIVSHLSATHPNHVNLHEEWVFNNAGGCMGAMYLIHASVTEYLIVFGTALGTEGHSGRHTADDYFMILRGEQYSWRADGSFEPTVYKQGDLHLQKRGEVKQYQMRDTCFALEYARGWIPPMLFFGFADSTFAKPIFMRMMQGALAKGGLLTYCSCSLFEHVGLPDFVEDRGYHRARDAVESGEDEAVGRCRHGGSKTGCGIRCRVQFAIQEEAAANV